MSSNWITDVDMLADAGIVNFDAAAYVKGTAPRYAGSPVFPANSQPNMKSQPRNDEYNNPNDKSLVKNSGWKKTLFGIVALGSAVLGAYKFRAKLIPYFTKQFESAEKLLTSDKTPMKDFFKGKWESFSKFCTDTVAKVKGNTSE